MTSGQNIQGTALSSSQYRAVRALLFVAASACVAVGAFLMTFPSGEGQTSTVLPIVLMATGIVLVAGFAFMGFRRSEQEARQTVEQQNDLQRQILSDRATGKPNMQWLGEFLADSSQSEKVESVVKVDIANLSAINYSFGHAAGDAAMATYGERLEAIGGEFLVRSPGPGFFVGFDHAIEDGCRELALVERAFSKPVVSDGAEIRLDARLGIANRDGSLTLEDLVTRADYAASPHGGECTRGIVSFFDEDMKREADDRYRVEALLRKAIADESFAVLYQPQVDVKTNEVCGYAAIASLKGNSGCTPEQLANIAEVTGLVAAVNRIVTKKVVQQLATWKKRHKRIAPITIGYSACQLDDEGYTDLLEGLLRENDVSPTLVKIAISDSLCSADRGKVEALLARLNGMKVPATVDITGINVSLVQLQNDYVSVIQIDSSSLQKSMSSDERDIMGKLVQMVHGFGKSVVAKNVETREQLQACVALECDVVQGGYYSGPVLPERAAQFKPQERKK